MSEERRLAACSFRKLQLGRVGQEHDDPFQQASRAAAIEAAMVETQSEFGLCGRNELVLLITPGRRLFSGPEANQQGLIRQRNRRSPIETECSEVRYRSNPAGCLFGSYPPAPVKIDQLAILSGET